MSRRHIVIELTERQSFADSGRAVLIAREARLMGFRMALDDTGSWHSGLAQVQELNLDIIKIDKKFVDMIDIGGTAESIVKMLVRLGDDLGLTTLAEVIETERQRHRLIACGVTQGYCYLVAPALPAASFVELMMRGAPHDEGAREIEAAA